MSVDHQRQIGPVMGLADRSASEFASSAGASLLDELMTARDVATVLQMKVSTVEDYARRGLLPSVKVGRHRRFIRSQLEQQLGALTRRQA